jgi:predicted porin
MKLSWITLAVLGAMSSLAQAQSGVTIYGTFDEGVRYATKVDAAGHSRITNSSTGTYNSNRIGFKGVEDLGGGLNAHFNLESGFNSGTGALNNTNNQLFQRQAFVGLGGQWGNVDLGRQYTVAFKTAGAYDPFNFKYSGIIPTSLASVAANTRNNNDIQYTGTFGPITARAEYALGEQPGVSNNRIAALGAAYTNGPVSVGAAYTKRKPAVVAETATTPAIYEDNTHYTFGGAVTFGPWRAAAGYARESQDTASAGSIVQKNAWIGGSYDFTPALALTAAYYDTKADGLGKAGNGSGKRGLYMVGATYALSKRTNLYADIDYTKYSGALVTSATGTTAATMAGLSGSPSQLPLASAPGQDRQLGVSVGVNLIF